MKQLYNYLTTHYDLHSLATDTSIQSQYQAQLTTLIQNDSILSSPDIASLSTPSIIFDHLRSCIHEAFISVVPKKPPPFHMSPGPSQVHSADPAIRLLSRNIWNLRQEINRAKHGDPVISSLKAQRSHLVNQLRKQLQRHRDYYLASMQTQLNNATSSAQRFRVLQRFKFCKYSPLQLSSPVTGLINNAPEFLFPIIRTYWQKFFNPDNHTPVHPWDGNPRPLIVPISSAEVLVAMHQLHNSRAPGIDQLPAECFKYSNECPLLAETIVTLFNSLFIQHQSIPQLSNGVLILLNKPGRDHSIDNTRPITLLTASRKILSLILLNRLTEKLSEYISPTQCGFIPGRSTADIFFSYKLLDAIAKRYNTEFHILAVDLSKAFDTINRNQLLWIMQHDMKLDESELRIARYMLADTMLTPCLQQKYDTPFPTNSGTPQGDCISPIFFIIYLEYVLRLSREQFKQHNPHLHSSPLQFNYDTAYADDTDIISTDMTHLHHCRAIFEATLQNHSSLSCNPNKTSIDTINAHPKQDRNFKKLGSQFLPINDVHYKISRAQQAFLQLYTFWTRTKHISIKQKLYYYQTCILPILLYNAHINNYNIAELERLDTCHRRHLRIMLGIFYPNHITNLKLYERTEVLPISLHIIIRRWNYLHRLLIPLHTTNRAHTLFLYYFLPHNLKFLHQNQSKQLDSQYQRSSANYHSIIHSINHDLQTYAAHLNLQVVDMRSLQYLILLLRNNQQWKSLKEMIRTNFLSIFTDKLRRSSQEHSFHMGNTLPITQPEDEPTNSILIKKRPYRQSEEQASKRTKSNNSQPSELKFRKQSREELALQHILQGTRSRPQKRKAEENDNSLGPHSVCCPPSKRLRPPRYQE